MNSFSYYDTTILSLGALFLGIIMLIKGGGWAVEAGVFIATRYGVSPLIVGFTIIAFGTSLPELIVSVVANLQGSPGIALGNVLGSNIANILMVLGCTALISVLKVNVSKMLVRDLIFMMLVTIGLTVLLYYGGISRLTGFAMLTILGSYIFFQYRAAGSKNPDIGADDGECMFKNDLFAYGTLLLGLICISVGAEFLVKGAKVSAGLIGVPESIIALSIIAFGTSLPELSTSIIAARKGQSEMVIGNIIGSNVFNILMILGFASLSKPIINGSFSPQILNFDVWITLFVSLCLVLILFIFGRINRVTGSLFFLSYIVYNIYIYMVNISA
ncbi:MAG: sodium transporter [Alphaproteobacteria bacterium]|nr:MAG: sodium transporter [Alphaproteobacteria bacterium]